MNFLGGQIGSLIVRRGERPFANTDERDEYRRQQRLNAAKRSQWERLEQDELTFNARWVEHRSSGRRFKVSTGLLDADRSPVVAYTPTEDGRDVIALEPQ